MTETRGPDRLLRRALIAIAGVTALTGAAQVLAPRRMLAPLSAEDDPTAHHFFGTVGMFMVVVGGGLLNALLRPGRDPVIVFWSAVQKFGASAAVGLGVYRRIFSPLALVVAGFDLLSGAIALAYWQRVRGR
jgi:hypothetical protein